jgi:glutaredoxin
MTSQPPATAIRVFWRPGCPYCAMLRLGLRSARVSADWVNIWEDRSGAAVVRRITGGDETVPTVVVGATAMVNPSARQVLAAVRASLPGAAPDADRSGLALKRAARALARRRAAHAADGSHR